MSMKNVSVLTDIVGNHTRGEEEVGVDHPTFGDGLKRGTCLSSWNWGINISSITYLGNASELMHQLWVSNELS